MTITEVDIARRLVQHPAVILELEDNDTFDLVAFNSGADAHPFRAAVFTVQSAIDLQRTKAPPRTTERAHDKREVCHRLGFEVAQGRGEFIRIRHFLSLLGNRIAPCDTDHSVSGFG